MRNTNSIRREARIHSIRKYIPTNVTKIAITDYISNKISWWIWKRRHLTNYSWYNRIHYKEAKKKLKSDVSIQNENRSLFNHTILDDLIIIVVSIYVFVMIRHSLLVRLILPAPVLISIFS